MFIIGIQIFNKYSCVFRFTFHFNKQVIKEVSNDSVKNKQQQPKPYQSLPSDNRGNVYNS